jgi:hypothetical protein
MTNPLAAHIARLYGQAGLRPQFRVTPVAQASVQPLLMARGYRVKDEAVTMMAASRPSVDLGDARIAIESAPSKEWLDGVPAL